MVEYGFIEWSYMVMHRCLTSKVMLRLKVGFPMEEPCYLMDVEPQDAGML